MIASSRVIRLLCVAVILLVSAYLLAPAGYLPISRPTWKPTLGDAKVIIDSLHNQEFVVDEAEAVKERWINDAADWNIDGPYNRTALYDLCGTTKWTPGLAFKCGQMRGGIGNIRNMVLSCLRYTIEAGGTSLIIPEITARAEDLIELTQGEHLPFTYMFDLDFFRHSMALACPQMRLVTHEAELGANLTKTGELYPKDLGPVDPYSTSLKSTKEWRSKFDSWLDIYKPPYGFSQATPTLVFLRENLPSLFDWPIISDSSPFIVSYGRILRFNPSILHVAATVFYALNKAHSLNLPPNATGVPQKHKFYGVHLRTEVDVAAGVATYAEQRVNHLSAAENNNALIYLASGPGPHIALFTTDAAAKNISVVNKFSLLERSPEYLDALEQLKKLKWDQQALVDYVLLLRSSNFGGMCASSFSWNIAYLRHVVVHGGFDVQRRRDGSSADGKEKDKEELPSGTCFHDDISNIFGPLEYRYWFAMGMWP